MLFYFFFRVVSATTAFLYPGYASYKVLSQRPAAEEELERWLMYWSVLGCIVAVEYVAEWLVSWLPFYYTIKTIFLLYLALPQTHGATYLYRAHLRPFFAAHEREIDSALAQLKTYIYASLQRILRAAWEHVSGTLRQMNIPVAGPGSASSSDANAQAGAAPLPSLGDPVSGPAQLASGLWSTYGPSVLASGAALLRQAQASAAQAANANAGHARRDELASEAQAPPYDLSEPGAPVPEANNPSRSSSSGSLRQRTDNGRSTFEEVEVPSDMEGEGEGEGRPAPQQRRTSWFGWGSSGGYERVKSE
ncbi:TB2/DP1, HVA22 family-domain-containing protein [Fomitopsis serialis]|uniref:TB2/DP1, HVA22 family-domain-containing protein n=1 Tax=Fomitopsis serialis TaxID=139415 RepID=UPI0020075C55|nr:TB2/DP1, HVA22 family-domain-containing protein [Neoantrodia serialis]KAH9914095.1 TB2/DP1, HVA22 family-domain-containing protein [Neoantrodia serialis]